MTDEQKKADTLNSIKERKDIIDKYYQTGYLDRDEAVKKIKELRITDENVGKVTAIRLTQSATPFQNTSNESIVAELEMQVDILIAELGTMN
ncbi:MAG: hypothetical protein IJ872_01745 [Eubacterium sp.]|nr:hypothetical protein [Eubacterium sp.]